MSSIPPNRIKLDVLILGGGFGGVYCGKELARAAKRGDITAGLVCDQNYMVFQPMLAEVAGGSLSPRDVINPLRRLCPGLRFIKGSVDRIDIDKKEVHVDTGSFSSGVIIEYKDLVLGLGAQIDLSRVPGMAEHAMLMQNVGDAMILRSTIISRIEEASVEQRKEIRERLLTFVVVGGGYSGVETAGEMLDLLHDMRKYYPHIEQDELRVILIHSRAHILQTLSQELGDYAADKLRKRGLKLILEERVKAVTATRVYLQSGDTIEAATVVSTVGNAPNAMIRSLVEHHSLPHSRYRLETTPELQIPGRENLWAVGDCAAVPLADGEEGELCPQTAQFAMRQGKQLAQNLLASRAGREMKAFGFKGLGELASIGHRTAVANVMGMRFSGFIAWFLWRTVYLSKLPGLDRKLRVMIEWTFDLFFPRDINLLNPRYTRLYRQMHLEEGDYLFHKGEPSFSLYVVKSGEVELRDQQGNTVRQIEAGDFFGERALVHGGGYLYDAVAGETTELIALSGEVVLPLFKNSRRLRRILAKTTAQASAEAELETIRKKLDDDLLSRPAGSLMRSDLATLCTTDTVSDAIALFKKRRFSCYPLLSPEGTLVSVLNREYFFDFLKRDDVDESTPLSRLEFMNLPQCHVDDTLETALEQMLRAGRHKCLVVDDEHRLHGIVTVMDLLGLSSQSRLADSI